MTDKPTLVAHAIEGYDREVGRAVWRLEDARERTLRVVKDVTTEMVDVDVDGNSIGSVLYHVALIEADWLYSEILERQLPENVRDLLPYDDRDEAGILTLVMGQALDEHLARLATIRGVLREALLGINSEEFNRARVLDQYQVSPAWVLHHLAQHEAEHRSEIGSVIARLKS